MENFFIGIDLGGTRVKIGIVAGEKIVAQKIIPARSADGLAGFLPQLQHEINGLIQDHSLQQQGLRGIGIAFPGLVDTVAKKIVYTNRKYDDAPFLDLEKWAQDAWAVPLIIDNDARMAAVGEWKYGAAKDTDDLVMMTIGTGIGTAAVIDGKLLRGKHFQAGCLGGHFNIQFEGRACICGNTGCAEAYGGSWSLEERIRQHALYPGSLFDLHRLHSFEAVFQYAAQQDALAIIILRQCMNAWLATITNLILAYDPEVVVLGGGVLKSANTILPYLREKIKKLAWSPWGTVDIRPSLLQEGAGILGIVHCLALELAGT